MKLQRKLNVILVILIILLVSLISFGGIYYKSKNQMVNKLPSYILGADLTGYRKVTLKVKESDADNSDSESTTSENEAKNNTSENTSENSVENAISSDDNVNETSNETSEDKNNKEKEKRENYKKSAQIIKGRLKSLKVQNYTVACDENTGRIEITLPENDQTDTILADIVEVGKFTIKDSKTDEVLLDNSDVRSVTITENQGYSSTQRVMNINLTTKGASKYKNVTKTYQNTVENTTANDTKNETAENETESNVIKGEEVTSETSSDDSSSSSEEKGTEVTLNIDSSKLLSTTFTEVIDNGRITLTLSSSSSSDSSSKDELYSTYNLAAIMENDPLPVEYEINGNTYVASEYSSNDMKILIYAECFVALVIAIVMILLYHGQGLMQAIISVGYIAILLIVLRLTNVVLSMEGIIAIGVGYVVNAIFSFMIASEMYSKKELNKKQRARITKNVAKKYSLVLIPVIIIALVCCFVNWTSIFSLGMILFWGILISWIYNILISKFLIG